MLAIALGRTYFWGTMSPTVTLKMPKWSALLLLAVLLVACGKEQLDPPAEQALGGQKSIPTVLNTEDPSNSVGDPKDGDGGGGTISDDGDDVGDGERNRKKRPS